MHRAFERARWAASLMIAVALGGCGAQTAADEDASPASDAAGNCGHPSASDAETPRPNTDVDYPLDGASLAEVVAESDLVVRGTVASCTHDVVLGDVSIRSTLIRVEPDTVLRGDADGEIEIAFETEDVTGGSRSPVVIHGRPVPEVGDDAIWILGEIPSGSKVEGYQLVNTASFFLFDDAGVVQNRSELPLLQEAAQLRTVDKIIEKIEGAG